jgi:CBS-domain-containing membrane protein
MTIHAKDLMVQDFETIDPNAPVEEAIYKISHGVIRETGYKTISLMVVDEMQRLCGVVTMFDLFYNLRPDFLNLDIDSRTLKWEGQLDLLIGNLRDKRVRQVMTPAVVGAMKNDHIMVLLDRMVKNRCYRMPVLNYDRLMGVVYLQDIYHYLFARRLAPTDVSRIAAHG